MKILITGAGGMLGTDLAEAFQKKNFTVSGVGRRAAPHLTIPYHVADLSDGKRLRDILIHERPDIVFHAAAMTKVDDCESQRDLAYRDNVTSTEALIDLCNQYQAFLCFFSTDYVFDGTKRGEYTENDVPNPLNYYGSTKYLAEQAICSRSHAYAIFRISWLYGLKGKSFPRTIFERAKTQDTFRVVNDQTGRPTFSRDLADAFSEYFLNAEMPGLDRLKNRIFHLANQGICTWAGFAEAILKKTYHSKQVVPIATDVLGLPALRPQNSVLSLERAGKELGIQLRDWHLALDEFLKHIQSEADVKTL